MHDQANELRKLVSHAPAAADPLRPGARLLVVAGGKGGVGTTTVAVNLAVELARSRQRTVLVDADSDGGDVAVFCGLEDRHTIADVIAGRRSVQEALQQGPGGVRILPGAWAIDHLAELPESTHARLVRDLEELTDEADVIVADAGNGRDAFARRLWQAAGQIVVVTSTELASVMDAYSSIKVLGKDIDAAPIHVLVNMAGGPLSAGNAQGRLRRACSRFLGIRLGGLGYVSQDAQIPTFTSQQRPLVLAAPTCRSARQIRRAAAKLAPRWPNRPERPKGVEPTVPHLPDAARREADAIPAHSAAKRCA